MSQNILENISQIISPASQFLRANEKFTNMKNMSEKMRREVAISIFITMLLVIFLQIMPVMLIAVNCNPDSPVTYGIIAFLFPGVYLFQHAVRKYLLKQKGYCGNK